MGKKNHLLCPNVGPQTQRKDLRYTYGSFSHLRCHYHSSCLYHCRHNWEECTSHCCKWTLWCCCSSWTGILPHRCCPHSHCNNHSDSGMAHIVHCHKWRLLMGKCERLGGKKDIGKRCFLVTICNVNIVTFLGLQFVLQRRCLPVRICNANIVTFLGLQFVSLLRQKCLKVGLDTKCF